MTTDSATHTGFSCPSRSKVWGWDAGAGGEVLDGLERGPHPHARADRHGRDEPDLVEAVVQSQRHMHASRRSRRGTSGPSASVYSPWAIVTPHGVSFARSGSTWMRS